MLIGYPIPIISHVHSAVHYGGLQNSVVHVHTMGIGMSLLNPAYLYRRFTIFRQCSKVSATPLHFAVYHPSIFPRVVVRAVMGPGKSFVMSGYRLVNKA